MWCVRCAEETGERRGCAAATAAFDDVAYLLLLLLPLLLLSLLLGPTIGSAAASQVALKLEHRSSKGCNYGPPYEWSVYG